MNEQMLEPIASLNHSDLMWMTSDVVSAYLGNNTLPAGQIPDVISTVYESFKHLSEQSPDLQRDKLKPAVPVKKSITPDYIVCLEDGKKLKMLKRHLRTTYSMSPEEYRAKWGLPVDYPMVAPNYAARRSQFAKDIGLGKGSSPKKRK